MLDFLKLQLGPFIGALWSNHITVIGCEALAIHLLVVIWLLVCAEIDPCEENMDEWITREPLKVKQYFANSRQLFSITSSDLQQWIARQWNKIVSTF